MYTEELYKPSRAVPSTGVSSEPIRPGEACSSPAGALGSGGRRSEAEAGAAGLVVVAAVAEVPFACADRQLAAGVADRDAVRHMVSEQASQMS